MSIDRDWPTKVEPNGTLVASLIGPLFLVLMVWFLIQPKPTLPSRGMHIVDSSDITTEPLRQIMADPPTVVMAGFEFKCVECHKLFDSFPETARELTQHQHITLNHGLNNRCFNCHDNENRNRLALPGDRTIPFGQVQLLCATCHGTTYRDWERGIHGRITGHWDAKYGKRIRLTCTQCHDPHRPAYAPMSVMPGPNTLRMDDPNAPEHIVMEEGHNPLRIHEPRQHETEHAAEPGSEDAPGHTPEQEAP